MLFNRLIYPIIILLTIFILFNQYKIILLQFKIIIKQNYLKLNNNLN
jgi:hypothetical protein